MSEILLICRTCLSEADNLLSIFKTAVELNAGELYLYELLKDLTGLKIRPNDEMPQTVCATCADQIGKFYNFRKQCIESDETLKSTLCIVDDDTNNEEILKTTIKLETDFNIYDENSIGEYHNSNMSDINATINDLGEITVKQQMDNNYDDEAMYDEYEVLEVMEEDPEQKYDPAMLAKPQYIATHDGEFEKFLSCFNSTTASDIDEIPEASIKSNYNSDDDTKHQELPVLNANRCVLCNDSFETADELKSHLENHLNDPQYECKLCMLTFKKARVYQNHMRIHKESTANDCNFCGKDLDGMSAENINSHIATHKPELIDGGYLCFFCEHKFKQNRDRKRHMTIKHMDLCYKYREQLQKVINDDQDDLRKMAILCEICGKEFISALSLKLHLNRHTGEKPYACEICDKRFATESYLKDHTIRHNPEKSFECEKCGKTFARKRSLKDHVKRHEGIRPYECHICYTRLSTRGSLHMHIRTHSGEKPYREQEQRRAPRIRSKKKKLPIIIEQFITTPTESNEISNDMVFVE